MFNRMFNYCFINPMKIIPGYPFKFQYKLVIVILCLYFTGHYLTTTTGDIFFAQFFLSLAVIMAIVGGLSMLLFNRF